MRTNLGGLVVIVALLFISGCGWFAATPGQTVKDFLNAVNDKDFETAQGCFSTRSQAQFGNKMFASIVGTADDMEKRGGLDSVEILDETINGDTATLTAIIKMGDGSHETMQVFLIKENDEWKLYPRK